MQPVLIVEDSEDIRNIYQIAFGNAGIPIVLKSSGLEALAEIKKINPSVILLDLLMPDINGIKFMQMIRGESSLKYPTFVCSNLSSKETIEECMALGALEYINKSNTDTKDIIKKITTFLEKQYQEENSTS